MKRNNLLWFFIVPLHYVVTTEHTSEWLVNVAFYYILQVLKKSAFLLSYRVLDIEKNYLKLICPFSLELASCLA